MTRRLWLTLVLVLALAAAARAADTLDEARRLVAAGRPAEALPILTRLAAAPDAGSEVFVELGSTCYQLSIMTEQEEQARAYRRRAREALLRAQALGSRDPLALQMLKSLPEDGGDSRLFSRVPEADLLMRRGEKAFAAHDTAAARGFYEQALNRDPTLYQAPLFLGDCCLVEKNYDEAMKWYARAVALDPSVETAYRYWGNALLRTGEPGQARRKYLEALVRSPYDQLVWKNGLGFWARYTGSTVRMPEVKPTVAVSGDSLQVDPKAPEASQAAWLAYGMVRMQWRQEKFDKLFPGRPYRRTLAEETEALATAAQVASELGDKPSADLALLQDLQKKGLLEAFVLFSRADQQIAEDYPAYAAQHQDLLLRFLEDYVAPEK